MIGKFSSRCVVSTPNLESLKLFNHDVQLNAYEVIYKVLNRFVNQGVKEFHFLADNSLNVEVNRKLKEFETEGVSAVLYDPIPNSLRKYWLDNFSTSDRLDLIFSQEQVKLRNEVTDKLEEEILKVFKGDSSKVSKDTLSNESKFKIVRSVYTLVTMGQPITEDNMKNVKHYYQDALFLMGMNAKVFKDSIMAEIDSHYEEANKYLLEASNQTMKRMSYVEASAPEKSELRRGIQGAIAMLKAKSNASDLKSGSKIEFEISHEAFEIEEELTDEELKNTTRDITMTEVFDSAENMYEAFVTGSKFEEFSALEKLSDKFAVEVLSSLSEPHNLLLNFYVQTTNQKYKALAQQTGNKLCLNVDLKTGEVDLTLKGQSFKLAPFFPNNEEVKTNANEW